MATVIPLQLAAVPVAAGLANIVGYDDSTLNVVARAFVLGLSLTILVSAPLRRSERLCHGAFLLAFAAIWAALMLRLTWDGVIDPFPLYWPLERIYQFTIGVSILPAAACVFVPNQSTLRRGMQLTFLATAGACVLMMYSYLIVNPFQGEYRFSPDRFNSIGFGHLGGTVVILSVCLAIEKKHRGTIRALAIGAVVVGFVAISMGASKGPFIATLVAIGLLAASRMHPSKLIATVALVIVLVGSAILIARIVEEQLGFGLLTRFERWHDETGSVELRVFLVENAWSQFLQSPIVGYRLVEVQSGMYPHNMVVECLMATGILGTFPLLVILCMALPRAWKLICHGRDAAWLGLLFTQYFVGALFSGTIMALGEFWCLAAAVVAAASTISGQTTPEASSLARRGRPVLTGTGARAIRPPSRSVGAGRGSREDG